MVTFFDGSVVQTNMYAVTCNFTRLSDSKSFLLSNIYDPSRSQEKMAFVTWLMNLDISLFDNWLLAGDFNLYRSQEDRSKPGGNPTEMAIFSIVIFQT